MNYFYSTDKLVNGKVGTKDFKGVSYPLVLHSATEEDSQPLAKSYDELMEKAPEMAEEMIWTEVEVDGAEGKEKRMLSIKEWRALLEPSHGPWYPRHIWLGVDPEFDVKKAEKFARKEPKEPKDKKLGEVN